MTATILDRAIGWISPETGERRVKARARMSVAMNYDAASKGRRTYGWKSPGSAADAAAYGSRAQMRNLSRDMIRNRPLAARAQMVVTGSVVGGGIIPSVKIENDATKSAIEKALRKHLWTPAIDAMGEHDLFGLQRIVMNAVFSDGEVFVRQRQRSGTFAAGLTLPFQIEVIEADWLNMSVRRYGQNDVIDGVEYGPIGDIVAYHFYDRHPGDIIPAALTSTRWEVAKVLHIRRVERPGQMRGVPWLAPVMMTLGEISDYVEAQILKQRMAALMAGIITSTVDGEMSNTDALADLSPGALVQAPEGSEISWTNPPKVDGFAEFIKQGVSMFATGIGVTYESVSGDLSQVNFSSAQLGHMVMDRNVEIWQALVINQFCQGVERWLKDFWRLVQTLPQVPFDLDWTAPRRPMINPRNDVPAAIDLVDSGLISRQRQQRQMGLDPEAIRRERAEDMRADQAAGLPPITPSAAQNQLPQDTQGATA